jgi:tryptophan synthase beta subunit
MKGKKILVTLSGRGDKDVDQIYSMIKQKVIRMPKY